MEKVLDFSKFGHCQGSSRQLTVLLDSDVVDSFYEPSCSSSFVAKDFDVRSGDLLKVITMRDGKRYECFFFLNVLDVYRHRDLPSFVPDGDVLVRFLSC